jgi:hypothetical protein
VLKLCSCVGGVTIADGLPHPSSPVPHEKDRLGGEGGLFQHSYRSRSLTTGDGGEAMLFERNRMLIVPELRCSSFKRISF